MSYYVKCCLFSTHRHLFSSSPDAEHPDTLALTFDTVTSYLTCVYNDHSVYVWDVRDVRNVGKVYSALYHSGCVWSVEVCITPDPLKYSIKCDGLTKTTVIENFAFQVIVVNVEIFR